MNDIQTEMIMNSDSSNIVNDILRELNNPQSSPATTKHEPIHLQMRERAQHIQPNSTLNENAVINQYDNMVTPMFEKYVRPMKKKSNIIIKKFGQSDIGYIKLIKQIQKIINE